MKSRSMAEHEPIVVIVEDDTIDVEALQRGIKKRNLEYNVHHEYNGQSAIELLQGDEFSLKQRERLIVILDINMPVMNGHQFLEAIREIPELRRTIVFVLTTSDDASDKGRAYDKNVAGYFVKSNVDGLLDTIEKYVANVEFPPLK